jgi:cytochrome c oxidase cbb3-type subunit II
MKRFPSILAGIFVTFALAWFGMAMMPLIQLGNLQPQSEEDGSDVYPVNVAGLTNQGRAVFAANGCFYCHSQQVRDRQNGADLERGWGDRRTVALDYLYDQHVFLGEMRNGPDLANIGNRQKDAAWHYAHLYDPRFTSPGSIMPPFRFLFEKRKIAGQRSDDALKLDPGMVEEGFEIVPNDQAKALVAYLLSLDRNHPLKSSAEAASAPAAPAPAAAPAAAAPAAPKEAKK